MRLAIFLLVSLGLSGCVEMKSLISEEDHPSDQSYFIVDTKFRFLCLGNSKDCKDMTKIVSARAQLSPIEEAYGKKITGPNYPISLTRMVLYPEDQSYKAIPIGNDGRFHSVPVTPRTMIVWDTLTAIEDELFPQGN